MSRYLIESSVLAKEYKNSTKYIDNIRTGRDDINRGQCPQCMEKDSVNAYGCEECNLIAITLKRNDMGYMRSLMNGHFDDIPLDKRVIRVDLTGLEAMDVLIFRSLTIERNLNECRMKIMGNAEDVIFVENIISSIDVYSDATLRDLRLAKKRLSESKGPSIKIDKLKQTVDEMIEQNMGVLADVYHRRHLKIAAIRENVRELNAANIAVNNSEKLLKLGKELLQDNEAIGNKLIELSQEILE